MFTGIIEEKAKVIEVTDYDQSLRVVLEKPISFDDLKIGDSIACNGVCLTVEAFDNSSMSFTIGYETLQITGWSKDQIKAQSFNLERSLRFGDRIHGHMVSGHVDDQSQLLKMENQGECLILDFQLPPNHKNLVWEKSSVAVNGVSLTVNKVDSSLDSFQVCLIPETLRKTNFESLTVGQRVNIETDYYMKGLLHSRGAADAQR